MSTDGPMLLGPMNIYGYDKIKFTKNAAWQRLRKQFPGHPDHHWRKSHSPAYWGWYAVKECNWTECPQCALVHLLAPDCKTSQCGVAGRSDADINFVTCQVCIDQHTIIQEREFCDHCGNPIEYGDFTVYAEAPFPTASTNIGESCIVCSICDSLKCEDLGSELPPRYTQEEMWQALARRIPGIGQMPRAQVGIIRAMEMVARHMFVYGEAGDTTLAWNIRQQFEHLDKHGTTKWPTR